MIFKVGDEIVITEAAHRYLSLRPLIGSVQKIESFHVPHYPKSGYNFIDANRGIYWLPIECARKATKLDKILA